MKVSSKFFPLTVFILVAMIVTLTSAVSPAVKGCHKINAKGIGAITGIVGDVTITEVDIIGGGLLNGTTRAEFTSPVSPDFFIGTLIFTTKHGTLEFEISNGQFIGMTQFRAIAVAVEGSGTGKLTGAEGCLVLEGDINPDGSFTEEVLGEICFD